MTSTYETDFYAWANDQAALLRAGRLAEIDIANLAEEIESMGRSEKRELHNRLVVLLTHLLKWEFQPGWRVPSWRLSIEEQRDRIVDHLADNPSLRAVLHRTYENAYRYALRAAQSETGLPARAFPPRNPHGLDQAMNGGFWPGDLDLLSGSPREQ